METPYSLVHADLAYILNTVTIKELDAFGLLNEINVSMPMGRDKTNPKILKESEKSAANPLTIYFNL